MLEPGTILLEKYRVERVLGQGGMGLVVSVRHERLGELFAIKTLLPNAREHPDAFERFVREARACAKLKGEHVVRVHDVGNFADGTPYMLMEHLEGEDLSHVLERRGSLPVDEAALYVHQACEAVAEAHANGIVHRDLKPSNLFLIRRPNGTPCVKVLDFGISKELDQTNKVGANLTKTGAFLGSPMYMSPEQMADLKTTGTPGDVWALGVILYEFVTGQAPFAAEAVTSVVTKVLLSQPAPPSHIQAGISPEFEAVIMRCLEKKPELRYPSAYELMAALQPFVGAVSPTVWPSIERSGSIPRAFIAPGVEAASKMPEFVVPPHVAMMETMADPSSRLPVSIASVGDALTSTPTSTLKSAQTPSSAAPPQTTVFAGPVVLESLSEQQAVATTPGVESANDTSHHPEQPLAQVDSKRRFKIGVIVGVTAILVLGLFAMTTQTATTTSTTSASVAVSTTPVEGPSATERPTPESTQTANDAGSIPPNDATSVATQPKPTQTSKTPRTAKVASPATTSRPGTTKKSKVPGYDD